MRAAVLYGAEDVRLERVAVPDCGPGQVRVRIEAALTCGTDAKVFRRGYHAKMIRPPAVFGHEFAGVIDVVGEGVEGFLVGQRVVAANSAPCGECFFCRKGHEALCEDLLFLNGAYAEYITVPERIVAKNLWPIPDHLPDRAAALCEPLACCVKGVEDTGVQAGDTVLVLGTGPIGLMMIALAAGLGAEVIAVGRREQRLAAAGALGARQVIDEAATDDLCAGAELDGRVGRRPGDRVRRPARGLGTGHRPDSAGRDVQPLWGLPLGHQDRGRHDADALRRVDRARVVPSHAAAHPARAAVAGRRRGFSRPIGERRDRSRASAGGVAPDGAADGVDQSGGAGALAPTRSPGSVRLL